MADRDVEIEHRELRGENEESRCEGREFRIVSRNPRFSPKVTTGNETCVFVYSVIPAQAESRFHSGGAEIHDTKIRSGTLTPMPHFSMRQILGLNK